MRMRQTIEIGCPPEHVWPYLEDTEKAKLWMKDVVYDVPTNEARTGLGATFRMSIKEGRKVQSYDGEIIAYEPNRIMGIRMAGGCFSENMSMTVYYRLEEIADGRTRLEYEGSGDLPGLWKLLGPLLMLFGRMKCRSYLRALKDVAESEGHVVPA